LDSNVWDREVDLLLKKFILLLMAIPVFAGPTISPSTATVKLGNTIQFSSTNTVTYTMIAGSRGSITSGGLYTAPSTMTVRNQIAGCPIVPNDHIYNVDITSLPVDSNSAGRMANIGSGIPLNFTDDQFPVNIMTSATSSDTMKFYYTDSSDGEKYPILAAPYRGVETNLYPADYFAQDRHQLGLNTDNCEFFEIYNYYPVGTATVNGCPTCNAQSGVRWDGTSYQLANGDGATDAAGLYLQPLALRYDEMKRGQVNHALRFTLSNGYNYSGFSWPGTNFAANCGTLATCVPYGSRFRLKSTFSEAGFSPPALAVIRALKKHGMFMSDGGINFHVQSMGDVFTDTSTYAALINEIPGSALDSGDFEIVDESSLMVSSATGRVKYPNSTNTTPVDFAIVLASDTVNHTSTTIHIALQPVTVGWKNPAFPANDGALNVMAGTPQFQIPYWVNGATTTTVSCTMAPTVGSLTSDCLYTPPSAQNNQVQVTTVTITPTGADATNSVFFPLVVYSTNGIRVDVGGKASTISSPVIPYSASNYGPDATGNLWFADAVGMNPPWYGQDDMSFPQAAWPGTTDVGLWYTARHGIADGAYSAVVPNGSYALKVNYAWDESPVTNRVQAIESQNTTIISSTAFVAKLTSTPYTTAFSSAVVTVSDNNFYLAFRYPETSGFTLVNSWSLIPISISTVPANGSLPRAFRGNGIFRGRGTYK
jgi:hypothetical protein